MNVLASPVSREGSTSIRIRLVSARWLLLLVPIAGYVSTASMYRDPNYPIMTLLCIAGLALLLSQLDKPARVALPVWIIAFAFLLGYLAKFYTMSRTIASGALWPYDPSLERVAADGTWMPQAFGVITVAFLSFCVSAWFCLGVTSGGCYQHLEEQPPDLSARSRARVARFSIKALWIIGGFMVVTGAIQAITGVGVMGSEAVVLPYRLSGLIYHPRTVGIPVFLLLVIWLTDAYRLKRLLMASLGMLALHGLTQSFLAASRGALLGNMMPVFLLWILQGRFTARRTRLVIGLVVVAAILHPVITGLRVLRAGGWGLSAETIQEARAVAELSKGPSAENVVLAGTTEIIRRVSGTEVMLYVANWPIPKAPSWETINYFLRDPERDLAKVMTQDVAGYGRSIVGHSIAPTLVAAPYVIGGTITAAAVAGLWVFVWMLGRALYMRLGWRTLPVIDASMMALLAVLTSDFALPGAFTRYMAFFMPSILLAEGLLRWHGIQPISKRHTRVPKPG